MRGQDDEVVFWESQFGGCHCSSVNLETLLLSRALPSRLVEVKQHRGVNQ